MTPTEIIARTIEAMVRPGCNHEMLCRLCLRDLRAAGFKILSREPTEVMVENIVREDFLRWSIYQGYTKEAKEAEWQRMRRIETEQFLRRWRAMWDAA